MIIRVSIIYCYADVAVRINPLGCHEEQILWLSWDLLVAGPFTTGKVKLNILKCTNDAERNLRAKLHLGNVQDAAASSVQ